jgi:hypothetical protein
MALFSPNLSKIETLANFIQEGGIPEYLKQKKISQKQADDFVGEEFHKRYHYNPSTDCFGEGGFGNAVFR